MALIPLPSANKALAKLTIIPFLYKKPYIIPAGPPFVAMYNPTSFSKSSNQTVVELAKTDKLPARLEFKQNGNNTIKVDLLLDATGASPAGGVIGLGLSKAAKVAGGVDILIANFYATTKSINPKAHSPNILRLIWGAGLFFECVLQSATVTYNLFDRLGRPLRATISATFREAQTPTSLAKIKNFFSSPDVTKTYTVVAGDTIYNLAQREYGDDSFYRQIAEFNNLKNYRKLVPGQILYFPPVNKEEVVE
jgi:nucleoid-associated protein YgaU